MPPRKNSPASNSVVLDERLKRVEDALVQINHTSEQVLEWKGEVSADLRWLKYLVGVGAAAGVFTAISEVIKVLK